jgi:hypothetical protein
MRQTMTAVATGAAVLVAGLAAGQAMACPDWQASPVFGDIRLQAGFAPDPVAYSITAGGTTALERCFSGNYTGFVTTRPDFDLYWEGASARLTIAAQSNADAILLVNAPDGKWYYSDDYRGTDPAITFVNPQAGLYDIWIGSYDGSRRNPGRLIFTELDW